MKGYGKFYTPGGTVAHLIEDRQWDDGGSLYGSEHYPQAACGWWGQHSYWRGTGSQTEYDRAEALPTCRKCVMAVGPTPAPTKLQHEVGAPGWSIADLD